VNGCWICEGPVRPCARFAPEPFIECERCGFVFRANLDGGSLQGVYLGGVYEQIRGQDYLDELPARRREARVRLRYVERWVRHGRLLDVGCASGAFLAEARASGFDASGVEPVPAFARAARECLGADVREGLIEDIDLPAGDYDVITLWHVLEHLPEPISHLSRLADALSADGALALEVPNAASVTAEHMGQGWPSLEPNVHINQFTPNSLRHALERVKLEVCDLRTTTITPYVRFLMRLGPRRVAGRAKAAVWLRDLRREHASGHELLRAVARRA
jgi:2-polyprenyl-3-methyl-5-hydroxy-6-metoxy-1,4-benzoquinol methylase